MTTFGICLTVLALAIWVGSIVFQSAVVAPSVFTALDSEHAGKFLRGLFPRFFKAGLVCGAVMLLGLALMYFGGAWSEDLTLFAAIVVAMSSLQAAAGAMVPAINAARDAGEAGRKRFGQLHGVNVLLTIAVLLLGIALIVVVATTALNALVSTA
ncbi:MAG: DUF4149 domain-containing protein [Pseudomonadota bacterium]